MMKRALHIAAVTIRAIWWVLIFLAIFLPGSADYWLPMMQK